MILDVGVNFSHVPGTFDSIITGRFVKENAMQGIIGRDVFHVPSRVIVHVFENCRFIASGVNCSNVSDSRDILSAKQFGQFSPKIWIK